MKDCYRVDNVQAKCAIALLDCHIFDEHAEKTFALLLPILAIVLIRDVINLARKQTLVQFSSVHMRRRNICYVASIFFSESMTLSVAHPKYISHIQYYFT